MKKYLFLYAVAVTALLVCGYGRYRRENRRLTQNQHTLAAGIERYRTRLGQEAASVQALRLRCAEFEELRAADAAEIRRLGIKLRRLEAAARTATATKVEIRTPVRDTVVVRLRDTLVVRDTLRLFRWRDAWVRVEGAVTADSVLCRVERRRHPAAGRTPHSAAFSLHPLGHESPAAGDRPVESAHADRLFGVRKNRTVGQNIRKR